MSWRPEGWKNPFELDYCPSREDFEAGADALLEALKARGKYNHTGYGRTDFPNARYGWFVFIPEEQP